MELLWLLVTLHLQAADAITARLTLAAFFFFPFFPTIFQPQKLEVMLESPETTEIMPFSVSVFVPLCDGHSGGGTELVK